MTVDKRETVMSWDELPTITTYLTAHEARDVTTAISAFTFTTEFVGATRDSARIDVVQHLEGDFPGGIADFHFRFTMDGALISRLVIEP